MIFLSFESGFAVALGSSPDFVVFAKGVAVSIGVLLVAESTDTFVSAVVGIVGTLGTITSLGGDDQSSESDSELELH